LLPDHDLGSDADEQGAWGRPVPARIGQAVAALALLAAGLFFVWQATFLPFGRVGLPGPGFFPFALGIALGLLALAILFYAWRETGTREEVFLGHRNVLVALAALAGVALLFERIDTYLALGGFAAVLLVFVARTSFWRAVVGTTLGMIGVWLFFRLALGVRLPAGEFWPQLGAVIPFGQF
jgi:hypothetical protein